MLIKLVEICKELGNSGPSSSGSKLSLRETFINPDHIVCMREETLGKEQLSEALEEIDPRQEFTRIYLNRGQVGLDITVVGSLDSVKEKLQKGKSLLKG